MKPLSDEKISFLKNFLERPLIARMATADPDCQPHVVPVWFGWDGKSIWISAFASTRKVKELFQNPKISVVIDIAEENGDTQGVLLEGKAEIIKEPVELVQKQSRWIYTRYLGEQGVQGKEPQSWIHDPENRIIQLTPDFIHTWSY